MNNSRSSLQLLKQMWYAQRKLVGCCKMHNSVYGLNSKLMWVFFPKNFVKLRHYDNHIRSHAKIEGEVGTLCMVMIRLF